MKIEGARRALREELRTGDVSRYAELAERLQRIRALLAEVREELKAEEDSLVGRVPAVGPLPPESPAEGEDPSSERQAPRQRRPRCKREETETKELFAFYEQSLF